MQLSKLSYKAVEFLRDMLAANGWAKSESAATSTERIYWSSKLIAEHIPEVPNWSVPEGELSPRQIQDFQEKVKTAMRGLAPTFDIPEKALNTVKHCISTHIKEGKTPSGAGMLELINAFELYKE